MAETQDNRLRIVAEHARALQATNWNLDLVVSGLRRSREVTHNIRHRGHITPTPSRDVLTKVLDGLSGALFPSHYGKQEVGPESIDYFVGFTLNTAFTQLAEQIEHSLVYTREEPQDETDLRALAVSITRDFATTLPSIRDLLVSDLRAAYKGDPAATNYPEIMLGYPGMLAIMYYRLAHALYERGATLVARLISDIAHSKTGIDIHPAAKIGASFFIDHGTGVVIGETAIIGERVRLYQAVTLGARSFPTDENGDLLKSAPRHPIVEDDVVIYAGATVLGRITIGKGSTIGGNVWLTRSVPEGSHISVTTANRGTAD